MFQKGAAYYEVHIGLKKQMKIVLRNHWFLAVYSQNVRKHPKLVEKLNLGFIVSEKIPVIRFLIGLKITVKDVSAEIDHQVL